MPKFTPRAIGGKKPGLLLRSYNILARSAEMGRKLREAKPFRKVRVRGNPKLPVEEWNGEGDCHPVQGHRLHRVAEEWKGSGNYHPM